MRDRGAVTDATPSGLAVGSRLPDLGAGAAVASPPAATRGGDRRARAPDLRVLLITEGTYPFRFGGVSTWCRNLISGLPSVDFHVLALVADPDLSPLFELPDNVSALTTVPLWGVHDALEIRAQLRMADLERAHLAPDEHGLADGLGRPLRGLVTAMFSATADPLAVADDVNALYEFFLLNDFDSAMRSATAWEAFVAAAETTYPAAARAAGYTSAPLGAADVLTGLHWLRHWLLPLSQPLPVADVAHATMAGECILVGVAAKLHDGAGLVFSEHGVYLREAYLRDAPDSGSLFLKLLNIGFARRTSEMAYAVSDQISTCCDYNQRWTYGDGVSRAQTIYYGVDVPADDASQPPSDRAPVITWLGRFDPLKGIETLLRAASIVHRQRPDAVFRLHGSATPDRTDYFDRMLALRDELGLDRTVELPGYTSDPQQAYGDADIVVLTSISEGFPYATLEAMACGRPIVATAVGGLPEQLGGSGVLVPPQSPELLAAALVDLIGDPDARSRLGTDARERARSTFSLHRMTRLHRDAYAAAADTDVENPRSRTNPRPASAASANGDGPLPRAGSDARVTAAINPLVDDISAEVPHPVDQREIAAVLETKGITDAAARSRFGVGDTFALAAAIFARLSRANGAAVLRPHRITPPDRERRRLPRAADGLLLLVPLVLLVGVFVWASSVPGWTSGTGQALLVGMATSALLGIGFRFAIIRRGALLIGCGRWDAARTFLWRWSWAAAIVLLVADLIAVLAARQLGHVSGPAAATFGLSFAALIVLWIISSGLDLAQRPHEAGLAMLAGVAVAVATYVASGTGSTLHAEIAIAAGYLAAMAIIAVRVADVLRHDEGGRATPRLPRPLFLLREAAPFAVYGVVLMVLVLAPNLVTALHAISGGPAGWRSVAVGMTLALVPVILAVPVAEGAPYALTRAVATVFSDATVQETGDRVGELLSGFHRRQARAYGVRLALLALIAAPVIWVLARRGALDRFGVASTGALMAAFAITVLAYVILALAQFDLMAPIAFGRPGTAVRSALAGVAAMLVVAVAAFPMGFVESGPVSLIAGTSVMALFAARASRGFFANVTHYLIGAM